MSSMHLDAGVDIDLRNNGDHCFAAIAACSPTGKQQPKRA